jgi:hypothetical protein
LQMITADADSTTIVFRISIGGLGDRGGASIALRRTRAPASSPAS